MNIAIFGSGYVGLVTGTCLANLGNTVTCIDIDQQRIANLQKNILPIYEPGLQELLIKNVQEKRLSFTADAAEAVKNAEVIFITVGTPQAANGEADLSYVFQVAATIGQHMNNYKVIVDKSTVPVGTADHVRHIVLQHQREKHPFDLVSNPEFLREGEAIYDFMNPDRIVIGASSEKAKEIMIRLYKGLERTEKPIFITDIKSSEIIKYAANAFLATKISFMNQIAQLCEKVGGDVKEVGKGIGLDNRIGSRFLQAGVGYGGSCFPKDVQALIHTAEQAELDFSILEAVHAVNEQQKQSLLPKIQKLVGDLQGKKIALLGLSFKPKTDDIRDAPSRTIINQLLVAGAKITAYDPIAMEAMKKHYTQITYCQDAYETAKDASCLVIVTEWDEFRYLDLKRIREVMKVPCIVDGRNIYDQKEACALGFQYIGVGRGTT
jgi:UDPglucose 6-dehydrogenase